MHQPLESTCSCDTCQFNRDHDAHPYFARHAAYVREIDRTVRQEDRWGRLALGAFAVFLIGVVISAPQARFFDLHPQVWC